MKGVCLMCCAATKNHCTNCGLIYYCSKECQVSHWNEHKPVCGKWDAEQFKELRDDYAHHYGSAYLTALGEPDIPPDGVIGLWREKDWDILISQAEQNPKLSAPQRQMALLICRHHKAYTAQCQRVMASAPERRSAAPTANDLRAKLILAERAFVELPLPNTIKKKVTPLELLSDRPYIEAWHAAIAPKEARSKTAKYLEFLLDQFPPSLCAELNEKLA